MKKALVSILLFAAGTATAAELPEFMTGSWKATTPDGAVVEEHWTSASGGLMVGMNRTVPKKGRTSFEFMRVATHEGRLAYLAMPGAKPATVFPLKTLTATRVEFENLNHDFPQRVIYWRSGKNLCARVEGTMNGKNEGEEWCWKPATIGR